MNWKYYFFLTLLVTKVELLLKFLKKRSSLYLANNLANLAITVNSIRVYSYYYHFQFHFLYKSSISMDIRVLDSYAEK
jgi:hypothetical protein